MSNPAGLDVLQTRHLRGYGPANRLLGLAARLMAREKRRRDAEHLRSLPDYLLRDIGLSRAEVATAVRCGSRVLEELRRG